MSFTEDDYLREPGLVVAEKYFDETGAAREWRYLNGDKLYFCGDKGQERRYKYENERYTSYLTGLPGREYECAREWHESGTWVRFTDFQGRWRKSCHYTEGGEWVRHYEGEPRKMRLVLHIYDRKEFTYYEGPKGAERPVRLFDMATGYMHYYDGFRHHERTVRIDCGDGQVDYFEGPQDEEHLVKRRTRKGALNYYTGKKGEERVVKRVARDKKRCFVYKGDPGEERVVRAYETTTPENWALGEVEVIEYEGEPKKERKVLSLSAGRSAIHYEGERDEERVARMLFHPSGQLNHYDRTKPPPEQLLRVVWASGPVDHKNASLEEHTRKREREKQTFDTEIKETWASVEEHAEGGKVTEQTLLVLGKRFKRIKELADEL